MPPHAAFAPCNLLFLFVKDPNLVGVVVLASWDAYVLLLPLAGPMWKCIPHSTSPHACKHMKGKISDSWMVRTEELRRVCKFYGKNASNVICGYI